MKQNLRNLLLPILVVTVAGALTVPASAQSSTGSDTTSAPAGTTIVVPVFGVAMVVNLVTNAAGEFVSADITPIAPPAPAPQATITDPTTGATTPVPADQPAIFEIRFDNGATTADVNVRLDDGSGRLVDTVVAAEAGEAQWVGDPLGNGDIVVVGYTASTDAAGALTLTIDSINGRTPADTGVVDSAGETTWYQVLAPRMNAGHLIQFITFFDAPADPAAQVSTNLTFDVTTADSQNGVAVSLTDPNAASTIDGTATPSRGEREGDDGGEHEREDEGERDD